MKTPMGITLIIAAAVLILAPIVSHQLHEARISELIARPGTASVHDVRDDALSFKSPKTVGVNPRHEQR